MRIIRVTWQLLDGPGAVYCSPIGGCDHAEWEGDIDALHSLHCAAFGYGDGLLGLGGTWQRP
jgi:hypothetical protein